MTEEKKRERAPAVRRLRAALLNWYPFGGGSHALLLGKDTAPLLPLLEKRYREVDLSIDRETRYDCIAAVDLIETAEDLPALLRTLNDALDEGGVLLLAFRNRFGLKYLCGGVDDCVKEPFSVLQPVGSAPRLRTRGEMAVLLRRVGFAPPRFYYLMPDADFVQAVYTDEHLPTDSIRDRVFPFDLCDSPLIAWEGDLYDDLVREGTLPALANVYLAECRKQGAAAPERRVVHAALSTDRGERNGFATVLYSDGTAGKLPLYPQGLVTLERMCANMAELKAGGILTVDHTLTEDGVEMPFIREEWLMHHLRRQLPDDPDAFLRVFELLYQDVLRSSPPVEEPPSDLAAVWGTEPGLLGPILQSAWIDMIPYNAFWADGRIRYYDQEFRVEHCPAKYVLFRALRYTWIHIPEAEKTLPLRDVKERFGLTACWEGFLARENRFVAENRNWEALGEIYAHAQPDRAAMRRRRELLAAAEL